MSALVHKGTFRSAITMSALSPKADIRSEKRFDQLPKRHCFLGPRAVPIIPVALTLRGPTASTMHAANLPASNCRRTTTPAGPCVGLRRRPEKATEGLLLDRLQHESLEIASLMMLLSQVVSRRTICPALLRSMATTPRFTELPSFVHSKPPP